MMAFYTRLKAMRALPADQNIVMERSVETDKRIFAQMMIDDGSIDPICARIYNEWFSDLANDKHKDIINVYIRTPPSVCHQRINKRARSGEEGITLEYLQRCHDLHDNWLMGKSYVIDGTLPTSAIVEKVMRILNN
jgi:deoxyadenosine/deoxycytidine kinase